MLLVKITRSKDPLLTTIDKGIGNYGEEGYQRRKSCER